MREPSPKIGLHLSHRRVFVVLFVVGLGLVVCFQFDRARPHPVVETSLEQTFVGQWLKGGAWRELPFTISPQEEADLQTCKRLGQKVRSTVNGTVEFTGDEVR